MAKGREFTVTEIERYHDGQEIYDIVSVEPTPPEEYAACGMFRVQPDMLMEGDTITVTLEAQKFRSNPHERPMILNLPVVRRADGKVITA